jgi:peptidoglycan/LPS O-acetylase OafA/YrhL
MQRTEYSSKRIVLILTHLVQIQFTYFLLSKFSDTVIVLTTQRIPMNKLSYRPDIDGLRGLAILLVVIFHAFPNFISGGYVGVDVFFVISGFLITGLIKKNIRADSFSFFEFYSGRIKRLFPALILVLIFCYAVGWFALYATEFAQLNKHILASSLFVLNIVLWFESGYFDTSSLTKPLLHLWSLGIEEKFYILWPVILFFTYKRKYFTWMLAVLFGISIVINLALVNTYPDMAFYFPLSRFWEICLGAILALTLDSPKAYLKQFLDKYRNHLSCLGLVCIFIVVAILDEKSSFPGWWAFLPTIGTALLITTNQSWINQKVLSNKRLVWIGLISYPLYLWHWPLLSFYSIIGAGERNNLVVLALVALAFLLAWITYRYWEQLFRYRGNWAVLVLCAGMIIVGSAGYSAYTRNGLDFRHKGILDLHGGRPAHLDDRCQQLFDQFTPSFCRISKNAGEIEVIIIGDSIAHNDFPGISESVQLRETNVAMVGWAGQQPLIKTNQEFGFTENNTQAMNALISKIGEGKSIKTVVIAFNQLNISDELIVQLKRTINFFKDKNKGLVFVLAPPPLSFDPISCVGMPPFRPVINKDCIQLTSDIPKAYFQQRELLIKTLEDNKVEIFDTYPIICDSKQCQIRTVQGLMYRTERYLSTKGSNLIFQDFQIK